MSMHRSLATGLWLVAAAGAYAVAAPWADDARSGKIAPWVLVVLFWGVALVSVAIHHLSHYLSDQLSRGTDALKRYWMEHRPAVNPAQAVAAVVDHSATLAARLIALIGVR